MCGKPKEAIMPELEGMVNQSRAVREAAVARFFDALTALISAVTPAIVKAITDNQR